MAIDKFTTIGCCKIVVKTNKVVEAHSDAILVSILRPKSLMRKICRILCFFFGHDLFPFKTLKMSFCRRCHKRYNEN